MIDLRGKKVIIFGGGEIAARKAAFFAREAAVVVVSRSFTSELEGLPVQRVRADIGSAEPDVIHRILDGAFLAVLATPDHSVHRFLGEICTAQGILVNDAMGEAGDVIVPSVVQGKGYVVAISTYGKAPTLPRFVREHLEATFPHMEEMVQLQESLRRELKAGGVGWQERAAILHAVLCDPAVWEALGAGQETAGRMARGRYLHGR
ncbi:MAG: bifunctional precorrin-2 dehydrogenase/sirohydrochlorin ferrochelatase [Methanomicrobiales archaeon]|nr:bifunctional precorrin-2 dehydrogenase/sirohydrochlorin ferrochelatase [Methanomicrobiales archaeon]